MDPPEFRRFSEDLEKQGTPPVEENRIPCRVLRPSLDRYVVFPSAWDGFCERRTSWYRKSDKAGKILVVSSTSFCHSDFGNPIMITESNFSPPRVPSPDEVAQLIESQEFQKKKPPIWEQVDPLEKEFYQRWLQRHRAEEPFDFEKIFAHHSANHANFLNP